MRRLKDRSQGPPEWFRYTHPETGHKTEARDYYTWVERAKEHRKANNLPDDPGLALKMEDQLCSVIPPELWEYEKEDDLTWVDTRIGARDVIDFTKVLIAQAISGNKFVSQEEANRRAKICSGCYLNVRVGGCGACNQLLDLVIDRQTDYDSLLQNCAVCKCFNRAQVHFDLAVLESSDTDWKQSHYPRSFCWKNKLSPEYQT